MEQAAIRHGCATAHRQRYITISIRHAGLIEIGLELSSCL